MSDFVTPLFTLFFALMPSTLFGTANRGAPQLLAKALHEQMKGDYASAGKTYRQYLLQAPDSAEAHANLGVVYEHLGKPAQAFQQYRAALKLKPSLSGIYLDLGIAYFREGDYRRAAPPLQRLISMQPGDRQAREILGLSLVETGRFRDAVRLLPPLGATNDPAALLALGASYVRLGQIARAQDVIGTLLVAQPNSPRVHFLLGQTFAGVDAFPQTLNEFMAVYALRPPLASNPIAPWSRRGQIRTLPEG